MLQTSIVNMFMLPRANTLSFTLSFPSYFGIPNDMHVDFCYYPPDPWDSVNIFWSIFFLLFRLDEQMANLLFCLPIHWPYPLSSPLYYRTHKLSFYFCYCIFSFTFFTWFFYNFYFLANIWNYCFICFKRICNQLLEDFNEISL